jgi:hypothetical protein
MARTTKTRHKVGPGKSGTPVVRASKLFPGRPKRTTGELAFETGQQVRLFADVDRVSSFHHRLHPFGRVFALQQLSIVENDLPCGIASRALCCALTGQRQLHGERRVHSDHLCDFVRSRELLSRRHDLRNQPSRECLVGVEGFGGQQLSGVIRAEPRGQPKRSPAEWHNAARHFQLGKTVLSAAVHRQ